MLDCIRQLTASCLSGLALLCREQPDIDRIALHRVQQSVGRDKAAEVLDALRELVGTGWSLDQIATMVNQLAEVRKSTTPIDRIVDLVLSGPRVAGIPTRDTATVMSELFAQAEDEVILVGYAVYNGSDVFQGLAERMQERPQLRVWMCLNVGRSQNDTSMDQEVLWRFQKEFYETHWPWPTRPQIYYDPRSLAQDTSTRSSLHAKCVIVDRKMALITSANFTNAAQQRNIEAGVTLSYPPIAKRLAEYFEGLRTSDILQQLR